MSSAFALDPKFQKAMIELGIEDTSKYLLYPPTGYKDYRTPVTVLSEAVDRFKKTGEASTVVRVKVTHPPKTSSTGRGPKRLSCRVTDGIQEATINVFGNVFPWIKAARVGEIITVSAKIDFWNNYLQLKSPELIPNLHVGRIVARYRGKEGLISSDDIEFAMRRMLSSPLLDASVMQVLGNFYGMSENEVLVRCGSQFDRISEIIQNLHYPQSRESLERACNDARKINALAVLNQAQQTEPKSNELSSIPIALPFVEEVIEQLPFPPTGDQKKAISEIVEDLQGRRTTDRLLSGDVGCGKTISYGIPAIASQKAGAFTVILLPNSLLASQVAKEIRELFPGTPVELLLGGGERPASLEENPIIVGTSAIVWWLRDLQKSKSRPDIDLLIIDEQQKLGAKQKEELLSKHTNVIEASATAIPRTVALVQYGGKSISRVEECPVVKDIKSRIVEPHNKGKAAGHLMSLVDAGHQVAVVYPLKERGNEFYAIEVEDKDAAEAVKKKLSKAGFKQLGRFIAETEITCNQLRFRVPEKLKGALSTLVKKEKYNPVAPFISQKEMTSLDRNVIQGVDFWESRYPGAVVTIHGGMSNEEKDEAMVKAKSGEAKVIITTSVIEIGLTVPGLRGLLVSNADKYGASTLHQLRGRLSRHGGVGFFYLAIDTPLADMNEDSVNRLKIVEANNNGRLLAELDMNQRGFGDISIDGEKQSGFMDGIFKGLKALPHDIEEVAKIAEVGS